MQESGSEEEKGRGRIGEGEERVIEIGGEIQSPAFIIEIINK